MTDALSAAKTPSEAKLEVNLDSVFIEDLAAEFLAAFDVAQLDEVAARPTFQCKGFHGDGKLALLRDDFHGFWTGLTR